MKYVLKKGQRVLSPWGLKGVDLKNNLSIIIMSKTLIYSCIFLNSIISNLKYGPSTFTLYFTPPHHDLLYFNINKKKKKNTKKYYILIMIYLLLIYFIIC